MSDNALWGYGSVLFGLNDGQLSKRGYVKVIPVECLCSQLNPLDGTFCHHDLAVVCANCWIYFCVLILNCGFSVDQSLFDLLTCVFCDHSTICTLALDFWLSISFIIVYIHLSLHWLLSAHHNAIGMKGEEGRTLSLKCYPGFNASH